MAKQLNGRALETAEIIKRKNLHGILRSLRGIPSQSNLCGIPRAFVDYKTVLEYKQAFMEYKEACMEYKEAFMESQEASME